jgi:CRP-like cAMP-binding protein
MGVILGSGRITAVAAAASPFADLMTVTRGIRRGEVVASTVRSRKHVAVLLEGMACMTSRQEHGGRQIYAFCHPGDFLGLHELMYPESGEYMEAEALSDCSIGMIDRDALEQALQRHPVLGKTLWRAAMIEAGVFRQRLVTARWPALKRVAHLLAEQLYRLGPEVRIVPVSQIDVADASGLTAVHTNRVFQDLRRLGVLSEKRSIEVVSRKRLNEVAAFDSRYLDSAESLSRWDIRIAD